MEDRQTNKLNEHRELKGVLTNYAPTIAKYDVVEEKVGEFNGLIGTIEDLARKTALNTTGITTSKGDVKLEMATLAAELAAGAMAYAANKKDAQLSAIFDVDYSDVADAKDEDALGITRMLCDQLNAHIEPLGRFLVYPEDVTELAGLADQFAELAELKGGTKTGSVTANQQLKVVFKKVDLLLREQLDLLMVRLKRKEPELVNAYFAVRHTTRKVDTGGSTPSEPLETE